MEYESLVELVAMYADKNFNEFSGELPPQLREWLVSALDSWDLNWDNLTSEQRMSFAHQYTEQYDPALANAQEAEAQSAYEETGLNGTSIDWRYWVHQMTTLSAAEAGRLMSTLDPDKFSSLDSRPGMDDPSQHCIKAGKIQRLAEREGMVNATPSAWLAWATERRIKVHAGFRIEVERLSAELPQNSKTLTLPGTESKQTPVPSDGASSGVAPFKQRNQERRILELLKVQGCELLKLPPREKGKSGAKALIRLAALKEPALFSKKSFEYAWQRLRDDGAIAGGK